MDRRAVRMGIAACVAVWLVVFCVPLLPHAKTLVICYGAAGLPCPYSYAGYQSLSRFLTGWGAVFLPPATMTLHLGNDYTVFDALGELLIVVLPTLAALSLLLSPELARHGVPRAIFGAFGAFMVFMAVVFFVLLGGGTPGSWFPWQSTTASPGP